MPRTNTVKTQASLLAAALLSPSRSTADSNVITEPKNVWMDGKQKSVEYHVEQIRHSGCASSPLSQDVDFYGDISSDAMDDSLIDRKFFSEQAPVDTPLEISAPIRTPVPFEIPCAGELNIQVLDADALEVQAEFDATLARFGFLASVPRGFSTNTLLDIQDYPIMDPRVCSVSQASGRTRESGLTLSTGTSPQPQVAEKASRARLRSAGLRKSTARWHCPSPYCSSEYSRKDNLRTHYRKVHLDEDPEMLLCAKVEPIDSLQRHEDVWQHARVQSAPAHLFPRETVHGTLDTFLPPMPVTASPHISSPVLPSNIIVGHELEDIWNQWMHTT